MKINKHAVTWKWKANKFQSVPIFRQPDRHAGGSECRIRQAILDVSMVNRQKGLSKVAARHKIPLNSLKPGDFVLFINPKFTSIALLGYGGALLYKKAPGGNKISPLFLKALPQAFRGGDLNYDKVMGPVLEQFIVKKRKRATGKAKRVTPNVEGASKRPEAPPAPHASSEPSAPVQ